MKKLDIKQGGHNFTGDDLLFMQSSIFEVLKAYADMFGQALLAIHGVVITTGGGNINWTAGWLYINGEICQVDAGSATLASNNTFVIVETYDPNGQQVYEDLNTEETYIIRKATISGTAGGANHYDNLKRAQLNGYGSFTNLGPLTSGNWISHIGGQLPGCRLDGVADVVFKGSVEVTNWASPTDDSILTLPVGLRPVHVIYLTCAAKVNTAYTQLVIEIDTTGTMKPQGLTTNDDVVIYLDGLRFRTKV